jgi:hypothetical protein
MSQTVTFPPAQSAQERTQSLIPWEPSSAA